MRYITACCFLTCCFLFRTPEGTHAQQLLREKIVIHTCKNVFHAGELMWFSIYVMDAATGKPVDLSKIVYVELLDSVNNPVSQGIIRMRDGRGNGSFVIPEIVPGVFTLRAYTSWMKNYPVSDYFHKSIAIVNARIANGGFVPVEETAYANKESTLNIRLGVDKNAYQKRQKVNLSIKTVEGGNSPLPADVSVSVYRLDSFTRIDLSSIEPKKNVSTSPLQILYPLEYNERMITGSVTFSESDSPAAGINVYVSVPGYSSGFYNAVSDSAGRFRVGIRDPVPSGNIIVQPDALNGEALTLQIDKPFSTAFINGAINEFSASTSLPLTLTEASINAQVEQAYHSKKRFQYLPERRDTTSLFGPPDFVYQLDDYTRFSKMEEIFREFIGPVAVSKKDNRFQLYMYEMQTHQTFTSPPLVLIDGYPISDINRLFSFDPLKIKTVEVINRKYIRGSTIFYGVLNLITYSHDLNGYEPEADAVVLTDNVIQQQRIFLSPAYTDGNRDDHTPDFRNVLFWSPSLLTDSLGEKQVSFYTSDLDGEYVAIVHGITKEGKSGNAVIKFTVTK